MSRITLLALLTVLVTGSAGDPVTGPAGVYTVTTTGPTRVTSGEGWVKIEWEVEPVVPKPPEPTKPTEPPPVVTPPPTVTPPAPVSTDVVPIQAGPAWIAAVYDDAKLGTYPPGQQALLASKTISQTLKDQKITWSAWKASEFGSGNWRENIAGKPLPLILVISAGGHTTQVYPLPADEAAMVAVGKKLRGQ